MPPIAPQPPNSTTAQHVQVQVQVQALAAPRLAWPGGKASQGTTMNQRTMKMPRRFTLTPLQ